jgi:hypothetical protein
MPIIVVSGNNAAELAANVAAKLDTDVQPLGQIFIVGNSSSARQLCQMMGESDSAITAYDVVSADSLGELGTKLDTKLATANTHLFGATQILGDNVNLRRFVQVVVTGDVGGGGGGSVTLPATGTALELQTGTETAVRLWSPKVIHDEIARQIAAIPPSA